MLSDIEGEIEGDKLSLILGLTDGLNDKEILGLKLGEIDALGEADGEIDGDNEGE